MFSSLVDGYLADPKRQKSESELCAQLVAWRDNNARLTPLLATARQADDVIRQEHADLVLLAREMLRDPYFPLHAARELGVKLPWPVQYFRAAPEGTPRRHSRGD